MATPESLDQPPEAVPPPKWMSAWLIKYVMIAGTRNVLIGLSLILAPNLYLAAAFVPLVEYTPLLAWGLAYLSTGLITYYGVFRHRIEVVRFGKSGMVITNAATTFAVWWGVVASWINPNTQDASPLIPLMMLAMTLEGLLVVRNPLRNPLSEYLETVDLGKKT